MKIAVAKEVFRAGGFTHAHIMPKAMGDGWVMLLCKDEEMQILSNDKGSERIFKTIDAAYKTAKSVGFDHALVTG